MKIVRRTFLAGMAASAIAPLAAPSPALATLPVPEGSGNPTLLDRMEHAYYRAKVPEVFVAAPFAPEHTPALVIGTGFGASVAALRLGQAGVRTVMLERGLPWPRDPWRPIFSSEFAPDGRALWHRRRFTGVSGIPAKVASFGGVLDVTDYENIQVWRGAAVGGGSVVFTGVLLEPEERFFRQIYGDRVDYSEMHDIYYPRARAMLKGSPIPRDVYDSSPFGHSRAWDADSRAAGFEPHPIDSIFDWDVVRKELNYQSRKSATVAESNFGNSNAAKYDLTQNYLKDALETGSVTVHHSHVVDSVGVDSDGRYRVRLRVIDHAGTTTKAREVTCDQLFLGAGSIGTSELLVKARDTGTLPRLSAEIGGGWGTNGDAAVTRSLSISGGLTQGAPSASRILDESGPLPVTLENWYVPGVPANIGVIGSLGMVMDETRGRFNYDAEQGKVVLDWPQSGNDAVVAAIRPVHARILKASKSFGGVPGLVPEINARFTAHPLGGAVLGIATDNYGRIEEYPGLYVVDGALVPGSAGTVNPALTITALAERSIEAIIRAGT